jgi:NAD(P)-dependent dehydrogenase (short-subunit alcohol dehydrogenase family)
MKNTGLADQVALVTGASSGLGRAVALRLAHEGAHVAVNYNRSEAAAREVVSAIEALGVRSMRVQADVAQPASVVGMAKAVEDQLGPIELLVANAGITRYVPARDLGGVTKPMWDAILGVNLVGSFMCVQAAVPQMEAAGSGSIVLVSSNSAFTAEGSSIPYVASKAAVITLTRTLARVLPPTIRVNAIAPGWMATRWLDTYFPDDVKAELLHTAPLTAVDDVADAAVSLLGNESANGAVLVLDSGEAAGRERRRS